MKKENTGVIAIAILALIPIFILASIQPLNERFLSLSLAFLNIGRMFGIVGMVLFSLTLVLNTRLKFLEPYFGGVDKMYKMHHKLGIIAFIMLLFHPLFLAFQYLFVSIRATALFLLPSVNLPVNFGQIALLLMIVFLYITFYVALHYKTWRATHRYLGVAFFFASLHVFFIPSDVSRNLILRGYMLSFAIIGIAAYSYRTLFGRTLVSKFDYRTESINQLSNNVVEVSLKPEKQALKHLPGQFMFISFPNSPFSETHPFTISSSPEESNIRISVKAVGDYTSQLNQLKPNTPAKIEGPFGKFSYKNYPDKEQIWIAGGIGITPFLSMARSLENKMNNKKIELYYSVKTRDEAIFLSELLRISKKNENFRVFPLYSSSQGHLTAEFISHGNSLKDKEILICGPNAMMASLRKQFLALGLRNKQIHSEEFIL